MQARNVYERPAQCLSLFPLCLCVCESVCVHNQWMGRSVWSPFASLPLGCLRLVCPVSPWPMPITTAFVSRHQSLPYLPVDLLEWPNGTLPVSGSCKKTSCSFSSAEQSRAKLKRGWAKRQQQSIGNGIRKGEKEKKSRTYRRAQIHIHIHSEIGAAIYNSATHSD